jgi:small neutral amino acid transporter SnatA (MarC family)
VNDLARFALVTFTSMLFIVDPIAAVPTYLVITQHETRPERQRTARRACVAMTVLLSCSPPPARFSSELSGSRCRPFAPPAA